MDISDEAYKTTSELNKNAIEKGNVILSVEDIANVSYQNGLFDLVFAIQTHIYWDELQKGFEEIFRVMSEDSALIISSEKDKIDYHMDNYKTTESLTKLLETIGFTGITVKEHGNWILYTAHKKT